MMTFLRNLTITLLGEKIITLFVMLFPPRSVMVRFFCKKEKNREMNKLLKFLMIFLFIFKTLIVMLFHEAFLVWTDHYKSWMSNVSLGFASANIAHPGKLHGMYHS